MKKILASIFLFMILLCGCSKNNEKSAFDNIIEKDVLVVGVKPDVKPFGYINTETGKYEGFDVDIAKYIARDILGSDRKIKFVSVNPDTRIESITSGKVDMVIATMSYTPQRNYFIDFSIPYYIAGQTAVVRKDSNIYNYADLRKKTTIVVVGTTAEDNLRKVVPTAKIVVYKDYNSAYDAFIKGKADAFVTDDAILSNFVYSHKKYRLLKNRLSIEPYCIGIKQSENGDKKLKNAIDSLINRLNNDGTLKYLKNKWHLQ